MTENPLSVRLDSETLARIQRVADELSKRAGGLSIGRPSALKLIVERGLPALEAELGLAKPPTRRKAKVGPRR